jgi:hypothetical protein
MSIASHEIPQDQWNEFFRDLSEEYQGWAVTVETLAGELGDQKSIDDLPLQGFSVEPPEGSQAGDILVEAGDAGTPYETHLIHHPRVLRTAITQPGLEGDVEIEDEEGVKTIVRLRHRPELPPAGQA